MPPNQEPSTPRPPEPQPTWSRPSGPEKDMGPRRPDWWFVIHRRFSQVGVALCVMLLVWIGLQLLALGAMRLWLPSTTAVPTWLTVLSSSGPLYLIAMPLAIAALVTVPRVRTRSFSMPVGEFLRLLVICLPLMYAGSIIGTTLSDLVTGGTAVNGVAELVSESDTLTSLVFMVLLAPVFEEWMFRRQIIDRLRAYGERTAILVSALAFALFHLNLYQFFYAFALGLVFGYVYTRTSKLRYSVAMHMIINLNGSVVAPWIVSLLGKRVLESLDSSSLAGVEAAIEANGSGVAAYMAYALVMMALVVLGIVFLVRDRRRIEFYPAPLELPRGLRLRTALLNPGMVTYMVLCVTVTAIVLLV
ncbi:lysostaphin resistance A-like protein [uncultured Bifidobacterium sp.]|uniref:lysostaphin resistance A-like protein n=1 Tax=uncultured Bifidobacterium sp. TaxID=165187 RepID=UPI0037DCAFDB